MFKLLLISWREALRYLAVTPLVIFDWLLKPWFKTQLLVNCKIRCKSTFGIASKSLVILINNLISFYNPSYIETLLLN